MALQLCSKHTRGKQKILATISDSDSLKKDTVKTMTGRILLLLTGFPGNAHEAAVEAEGIQISSG